MSVKIAFLTGARCEYGLSKPLIKSLAGDRRFDLSIFASGMHLLKRFGHTIDEIKNDDLKVDLAIKTYGASNGEKAREFTRSIEKIYKALKGRRLDAVLIAGDRVEAYAAALAAHFLKIPIIHLGGGAVTKGALDDIYRWNISNLSSLHFATSKGCYERLILSPATDRRQVHFFGSTAVDAILKFKRSPAPVTDIVPGIERHNFALMTFHSVTGKREDVAKVMNGAIRKILSYGSGVLITYPNNDEGYESIIKVIDRWKNDHRVFVRRSLGARGYYCALNDCLFVIGNSSSGIIEAPYFNKTVVNIGSRQEGRDRDRATLDVICDDKAVNRALERGFKKGWPGAKCDFVYGRGDVIGKTKGAILKFVRESR